MQEIADIVFHMYREDFLAFGYEREAFPQVIGGKIEPLANTVLQAGSTVVDNVHQFQVRSFAALVRLASS